MRNRLLLFVLLLWSGAACAAPTILVLGDSLSAAFGIPTEDGWVSLLARRLAAEGHPHRVVNASISGETTRGALSRLPAALARHRPAIVIVELGGNDGLRGLSLEEMRANLAAIVEAVRTTGAQPLLVGVYLPPNYGPAYTQRFQAVYRELADQRRLPLVPFLLEGVATDPALMQSDGIHPNGAAQPRLLDNLWPALEPLLTR